MAGAAGHGFPALTKRYDLTEQGARVKDTRPVADPRHEVSAATMEALLWQAGAFGLLAPMVVLQYEPAPYAASEKVRLGALAWDDTVHVSETGTGSSWAWVTITRNAAGDYSFQFAATAQDAFGVSQSVTFTGAQAQACGLDGLEGANLFAATWVVDARTIRVRVRDVAGTLTESPVFLLCFGGS